MTVEIFTSASCSACKQAKEFLSRKGIPFAERNISDDSSAREELIKLGFNAVPVIRVDGQTMLGFSAPKLSRMLGLV